MQRLKMLVLFLILPFGASAVAAPRLNPYFMDQKQLESVDMARREGKISLQSYISNMSEKLDFYYTFQTGPGNNSWQFFLLKFIKPTPGVDDINGVVEEINAASIGVSAVRDKSNPAVIHIVDETLAKVDDYVLAKRVSLPFIGKMAGLPYAIDVATGKKGRIDTPSSGGLGEHLYDEKTQISMFFKDTTVREVLTNTVPLSRYPRLLWEAKTGTVEGKLTTQVKNFGPDRWGRDTFLTRTTIIEEDVAVDFSEGVRAYAINAENEKNAAAALAFIEDRMKQKEHLQVRWAMFWLSKYKVEKAIPTLLKFLSYEYSPMPLLDERFPAFRALKEIGLPAATAALDALPKETDPRRLELLCRIVLSTQGGVEGRNSIRTVLDAIPDLAQKERLKAAWKQAEEPTPTATVVWPGEMREKPAMPQPAAIVKPVE